VLASQQHRRAEEGFFFKEYVVKVKCDYCGKELDRKPYRIKNAKHHFCNRDHCCKWKNSQARPLPPSRTCPECGGPKSAHAKRCQKCWFASEQFQQHCAQVIVKAQEAVRGSTRTPEQREKYRQAALKSWTNNPKRRESLSKRSKVYWATHEHPFQGRAVPQAEKDAISKANKGKKRSPEFCQQMSEFAKQRTGEANSFYGKYHSPETRREQSLVKVGKVPNWCRGIYLSPIAGEFKYQSSFELRFAQVLDTLNWQWERSPDAFEYRKADGTGAFYTPDFKVLLNGQIRYFETKGYFPEEVQSKVQQAQLQATIIIVTLPILEMFERYAESQP